LSMLNYSLTMSPALECNRIYLAWSVEKIGQELTSLSY
jgi:hypothetical protein